ncbi:MAG: hypothetical protein PHQ54_02710 [Candidatus Omnitrophica bacterium]|nr:hypothetical protein [Candidatus Omnitrophota bacterium]
MKNINFRKAVYLGIFFVSVFAILIRIAAVKTERSRPIISFISEWSSKGVPVMVKRVMPEDIAIYTKFTVVVNSDKTASGFVTADIKEKLKEGSRVYFAQKDLSVGVIVNVSDKVDIDSGMFAVNIEFNALFAKPDSIQVVFAHTEALERVLAVPNEALDISGDGYYLWVVEDARARKRKVEIGPRNDYQAIVKSGIQAGDLAVFNGQSQLKENVLVDIINEDRTE